MWMTLPKLKIENTIWSTIDDSLIELDYGYLEEQFAAKVPQIMM